MSLKQKKRNPKRFCGGPTPRTERGKRRHANREAGKRKHANLIHTGGYVVVEQEPRQEN